MARFSHALSTVLLFAAFLVCVSALPVADRQERHFDESKGPSQGNSTASGAAPAVGTTGGAPSEGTTPPSADSAPTATGESVGEGVSTETTTEPSGEETTSEPDADASTSPDEDSESSSSPDDDEDASPTDGDDDDDDGSVCFPANARVELEDGSTVSMDEISIGDSVKVGVNQYSKVFMFTHRLATVAHKFVVLKTASGASLALTKGHYIYADGSLVAASEVKVGSTVSLGNGDRDTVVSVASTMAQGLYNPQTVNGNIVVNNVLASTYTMAVEPAFAHAILSPFRFLSTIGLQFTALESGGGILADVAPRGSAF